MRASSLRPSGSTFRSRLLRLGLVCRGPVSYCRGGRDALRGRSTHESPSENMHSSASGSGWVGKRSVRWGVGLHAYADGVQEAAESRTFIPHAHVLYCATFLVRPPSPVFLLRSGLRLSVPRRASGFSSLVPQVRIFLQRERLGSMYDCVDFLHHPQRGWVRRTA